MVDLCEHCDIPENPSYDIESESYFTCSDCACSTCCYVHCCDGQCGEKETSEK